MVPAKYCWTFFSLIILAGCAAIPVEPGRTSGVIRGEEYVIHPAVSGDTWASLADTYLKDKNQGWLIADFNKSGEIVSGREIVIPLVHPNPVGVYPSGYQTVTILCYHRFGPNKSKMVLTPDNFDAQMAYLKKHDYRIIPLSSIHSFLRGEAALPQRAVVITIDDGYRSSYDIAYPILKKFNYPATMFIYSDFAGSKDALGVAQMKEMIESGLVDIQPHSKTHMSMAKRLANESNEAYRKRIDEEIRIPGLQIRKGLGLPLHTFAYPYGESNEFMISQLKNAGYSAGVTVVAGGNPSFAYPFKLRRTMIYGDRDMDSFIRNLRVFSKENLK